MLRVPLGASVTLWEATAPVKLPDWQCPYTGLRYQVRVPVFPEWYPNVDSIEADAPTSKSPTYPVYELQLLNIKL